MVGSKIMKMSLVYLEGFTDPELHKQNLISVSTFPNRLHSDCICHGLENQDAAGVWSC